MKVFLGLALFAAVAFAEPPLYQPQQQQQQRYFFARRQEEQVQAAPGPYPARGWRPEGPAFNLPERQQQASPQVDNAYGAPAQQQYSPPRPQYGPPKPARQQYSTPSQPQVSVFKPQFGGQQQYTQPQQQFRQPQQQQYNSQPQSQYGAPEFRTESTQDIEEPTTVGPLAESESAVSPSSASEFDEDEAELNEGQDDAAAPRQQQDQQERGEYYVALPDGRLQRVRYVSRQDVEAMRYFAKIRAENVEPLRGPIYAYSPLQKLEVTPGALTLGGGVTSLAEELDPNTLTATMHERRPEKLVDAPKVDVKPLAQLQIQHDAPQPVVPLSSGYAAFTADYRVPAAPQERFILALP
ncbi:nuclear transcription factor Y subunit beta-like [Copidosoma floridanum]|uniref:nuclear transcription factor Y subunit beta-like n=1 Tax=Copidosoma floridanum TaxID=29053 RepID=UPI0006C976A8|nr:nuclear transcription factor Y subunit beta-like [Copidosoma floridanum]